MSKEVKRILYAMPETMGDVFISTGAIDSIAKKWPKAKIYFATDPKYFDILKDNPNITDVVPFDDSMLNYRQFETWGPQKNLFDVVYCPFIVTQRIPHWIHGGYGEYLGTVYSHMCNVPLGEQFIKIDPVDTLGLPEALSFITVHSQTRQDPKDYSRIQDVVNNIHGCKIVQVGGKEDKKLDNVDLDLRGKTTPQELAGVLFKSKMHLGLDSFPMHLALHVGCPTVALFGGTYAKQGTNPNRANMLTAIETEDRGFCTTSCHLIECEAKKNGFKKCIDNIPVRKVLEEVAKIIGNENVDIPKKPTVSAYVIIKDGIKYGFQFEKCIEKAALVAEEVVVVDGGSTDGTREKLDEIANGFPEVLKVYDHEWDMTSPTLFGDEKTYARQQCTQDWLIQLDADEIITEPYPGAISDLIERKEDCLVIDLPCINFYGDTEHIRIEDNVWKWRISKNDPKIIHGVYGKARQLDPETLKITMDKKISDGCEYINTESLEIAPHQPGYNPLLMVAHQSVKTGEMPAKTYLEVLNDAIENGPVVFHYSWMDLDRKKKGGEFWNETFHGKKDATHNTSKDIEARIEQKKDIVIEVNFNHPLREK